MTCSKNIITCILLVLWLAGCSFQSAEESPKTELSASFHLGPIATLSVMTESSSPTWGLPTTKAFYIRSRVLDRNTLTPRAGDSFVLWRENQSELLKADAEGWITWKEVISFLPLAPENLIELNRKLVGTSGTELIRFAVNPWSVSGELIDLQPPQAFAVPNLVPPTESEAALKGHQAYQPQKHLAGPSNLQVDHIDLNLGELRKNRSHLLEVSMDLKAIRQKRDGSFAPVELPSGKFRVSLKFLQEEKPTNLQKQWAAVTAVEAEIAQGKLVFKTDLPVTQVADDINPRKLHIFLEPADHSIGLLSYQGELLLTSRIGHQSGLPIALPSDFKVSLSLEEPTTSQNSFMLRRPRITSGGEQSFDPETWAIKTWVDADICLVYTQSRLPISNQMFQVGISDTRSGENARLAPVSTDVDGCLSWTNAVEFSEGAPYGPMEKFLVVKGMGNRFNDEIETVPISINPFEDGTLFFRDPARGGDVPLAPATHRPYLVAEDMNYSYENPTFELNSHLQLVTHRQYLSSLRVGIHRPGKLDRRLEPDALRKGSRIKIRGLLLHPLFVDKTRRGLNVERPVLAGFTANAKVNEYGNLEFVLEFPTEFSKGPLLDSRTKILLELIPEGGLPTARPESARYLAPFKAVAGQSDSGDTKFSKADYSEAQFEELWQAGEKSGKSYQYVNRGNTATSFASFTGWKQSPLEMFIAYWRSLGGPLHLVSTGSTIPDGWKSHEAWTREMQSQGAPSPRPDDISTFCHSLKEEKTQCLLAPGNFFHVSGMKIVDQIPETRLSPPQVSTPLFQVTATYFREFMFSKRFLDGKRKIREFATATTGKLGLGLLENGVAHTRAFIVQDESYDAEEALVQEDLRVRLQMQEQLNLSGEGKRFDFTASAHSCRMVRPIASIALTNPEAPSYLFCADAEVRDLDESWYYVWDQWRQLSSSHVDPRAPWPRGWTKLIRGRVNYESFKSNLANGVHFFVMKKIEPLYRGVDPLVEAAFHGSQGIRLHEDGGLFPGVTQFEEYSPLLWTEQQIERYTALCEGDEPDPATAPTTQVDRWKTKRRYCRCYYENAARFTQHGEFLKSREDRERDLDQIGIKNRCIKLAKGAQR